VPSKEFKKLRPDQPVELVLDSTGQRMQGQIKLVSPVIDPTSGTIKVTIEVHDYPEGTRAGDFAQVNIVTETRAGATLVPKIAVISDKGDDVIYTDVGGSAERRVVEVGFTDDEHAEILSGVQVGESVVVKGQRSLKNGSPLKILERDGKPVAPEEAVADETPPPAGGRGAR
jgi:membrane fusion protein (multidrug efflux system)